MVFTAHRPYDPNQPRVPAGVSEGGQWLPYPEGFHPLLRGNLDLEILAQQVGELEELSPMALLSGRGLMAAVIGMVADKVWDGLLSEIKQAVVHDMQERNRAASIANRRRAVSYRLMKSKDFSPVPRTATATRIKRARFVDPFR